LLGMARNCLDDDTLLLPSLRPAQDWSTLLNSLGHLYVRGYPIDWNRFDSSYAYSAVELPTYPFQRQRYWVDVVPTRARSTSSNHPILGDRLNLARTEDIYFEGVIDPARLSYFQEHAVFERPILPATGFIELVLSAFLQVIDGEQATIQNLKILRPLLVEQAQTVQIILSPDENPPHGYKFEVLTRSVESWQSHATGSISSQGQETASDSTLTTAQELCKQAIAPVDCYQRLASQGITYGDNFRPLHQVWSGDGQALSLVQLSEEVSSLAEKYRIHPILLDACLQTIVAVPIGDLEPQTYLPAGCNEFVLHCESISGNRIWSHVQVEGTATDLTATIQLYSESGELLASFLGFQLRPANPKLLFGSRAAGENSSDQEAWKDWLWQVNWQPQPLVQARTLPSPDALAAELKSDITQQSEVQDYLEHLPKLEALASSLILDAIATLHQDSQGAHENLLDRWQVVPQHRQFGDYLIQILRETYSFEGSVEAFLTSHSVNQSNQAQTLLNQHPELEAEIALIERCGTKLIEVLRGDIEPITVLFPQGDMSNLTQLYQSSPGAKFMNQKVRATLKAMLSSGNEKQAP
ncbi:MAG: polyketide synthase dehydratase domain-containing protein, partial [Cyanobacteria bacterium P01_F01_bin.42]